MQCRSQIKQLEDRLKFTHSNRMMIFLRSDSDENIGRICDIQTKHSTVSSIADLSTSFCVGKGLSLDQAKAIGFEDEDIRSMNNDVSFSIDRDGVGAFLVHSGKWLNLSGEIKVQDFRPIYTDSAGLLLIGGKFRNKWKRQNIQNQANRQMIRMDFIKGLDGENAISELSIGRLPYTATCPSALSFYQRTERIFVCGGWWRNSYLSASYLYNFGTSKWTKLPDMKHERQSAGICLWNERGGNVVVAGGFRNCKFVEEFDMEKAKWVSLPNLKGDHVASPGLMVSNNILYCVGGVDSKSNGLGSIEMYDPRDSTNQWVVIDSVQKHFGIPEAENRGAGFNCFLPL